MPGVVSPWLDAEFAPIEEDLALLKSQRHRRFIKTHSPFDGIPYYETGTYLVILRDPRDAYFSMVNHGENMSDEELVAGIFSHGNDTFGGWLQAVREPGTWDHLSLSSLTHFFQTYNQFAHLPNLHFFHYSDMKRNLRQTIADMADSVDIDVDESTLDAYVNAASFTNMKSNAGQFAPGAGTGMWKNKGDFFRNGSNRQWQARVSDEELATFESKLAGLVEPGDASWLVNGSAGAPSPG